MPESDEMFELLSPDTNRKMEFLYTTVEPGVRSRPRRFAHEREECGIIIRGTLKLRAGDSGFMLEEGDSAYFPSIIQHDWEIVGDVPVESIWVIMPPSFRLGSRAFQPIRRVQPPSRGAIVRRRRVQAGCLSPSAGCDHVIWTRREIDGAVR